MAAKAVLVDTGPIVAVIDTDDSYHEVCKQQFGDLPETLFTCWPAITEAAWLLRAFPEQVRALLDSCQGSPYTILPLTANDVPGINGILAKYHDQGFQFADAALMHLAEREGISTVFTIDQSDFSVFRNHKGQPLQLLPSIQ
jgi:predicted nucleic acid-binding protein